ncbi:CocE/NonD family hydrolase [Leifsonia sp. NPDC056665]|uniref:CocE/NonD family hydrolase n=1 Tax=Leifsonia sp. NPDC056665 TaxID=3345901 RepID=UPI0036ABC167
MLDQLTREDLSLIEKVIGPVGATRLGREEVTVRTSDGVTLYGTVTRPIDDGTLPAILIRTPYGRAEMHAAAAYLATRGYAVVIQDTRTSTSYFHEAGDGRTTVDWIEKQPWFDGNLMLTGFSYLGFAAWATASTRPASLRAMAIAEYSSDRVTAWYPGGAFTLDQALTWSVDNEPGGSATPPKADDFAHLPLSDADKAATGSTLSFYQERLEFGARSPHWAPIDYSNIAENAGVPVLLFDGWYDYHRIPILQDFERLGRAGVPRRLVIGPWTHHPLDMPKFFEEVAAWFDLHVKGKGQPRPEASLYDTGACEWVHCAEWSDNVPSHTLYAAASNQLDAVPSPQPTDIGWTYNPLDPTPAVGITAFGGLDVGGPQDNRDLIGRDDVVTFTSSVLEADLPTAGRVTAHVAVRADTPSVDLFIRVLDVTAAGEAFNVCEAIRRISDPGLRTTGGLVLDIDLGPIAHRFGKGHAVAVLVASGAFPYYDRNLGYGEPSQSATRARASHPVLQVGGIDGLLITFSNHPVSV